MEAAGGVVAGIARSIKELLLRTHQDTGVAFIHTAGAEQAGQMMANGVPLLGSGRLSYSRETRLIRLSGHDRTQQ